MKKEVLIILVVFLLIGGAILYNYSSSKKKKQSQEETSTLYIYKEELKTKGATGLDYRYYVTKEDTSKDVLVKKYVCQNKDCQDLALTSSNILIYDGKSYLYNFNKDTKIEINLDVTKYKSFKIEEINGLAHGLLVYKDSKNGTYYSLKEQKLISKFIYNDLWVHDEDMLKAGYIFANKETKERNYRQFLLEIKTGKVMLNKDDFFGVLSKNGQLYYLFEKDNLDQVKIYNSKLKLLFNGKKYSLSKLMITDNGNLLVVGDDEKVIEEYDPAGKLITSSDTYQEIFLISDNIICLVDQDGYLKAIDNKGKEITTFIKFTSNLKFYPLTSFIAKGKIQLIIEDTKIKKGDNGYCRSYSYELETKKSNVEEVDLCFEN
ncbi:MAG: hypothetical protein ACOXZR_03865 [Bacilli bacterium]|jgi:sulfur transfer complex TusBCD TusB component (DsrH family)